MKTLEHRYAPRGNIRRAFGVRDAELLLSGPAGTGKSRGAEEKLLRMALKYPGMRGVILRKTAASLGNTALATWTSHVAVESLAAGMCWWYGGSVQKPAGYVFSNGSFIAVGGLDNPDKIMSSEFDVAYIQEATDVTVEDWEKVGTRLRNGVIPYQQLIADCNPSSESHWLKQRANAGVTTILPTTHRDNPRLYTPDGELTDYGTTYMAKLGNLTGVRRLRLLDGLWASAEGVIWDTWDESVHLVDHFEIPAAWPRYWSIDFGYTNPFVCQMWAEDPDGRLYMYREFYRTQRLVEDHARDILDTVSEMDERTGQRRWFEPKPQAIICDHDAEDRATLERHLKLPTKAATKTVAGGLQAVSGRLRSAGGRPRLFLLRGVLVHSDQNLVDRKLPTCTAEEIPGYVWDTSGGKKLKEVPLKRDDHGCDALRYVVAYRDIRREPRIRWL